MNKILCKRLLLATHNGSQSRFKRTDELILASLVVAIHDFEPQRLMLLEVITQKEALLEVRVKVVLDLLRATVLDPLLLGGVCLLVNEANGVGVPLAESVHVLQASTLDEQLHLV